MLVLVKSRRASAKTWGARLRTQLSLQSYATMNSGKCQENSTLRGVLPEPHAVYACQSQYLPLLAEVEVHYNTTPSNYSDNNREDPRNAGDKKTRH